MKKRVRPKICRNCSKKCRKRQARCKICRKKDLLALVKDVNPTSITPKQATIVILLNLGLGTVLGLTKKPIQTSGIPIRHTHEARNWLHLPTDLMLLIFTKIGVLKLLLNVQMVCSFWFNLSKQPCLFHSVDIRQLPQCDSNFTLQNRLSILAKKAMARSCGRMLRFSCGSALIDHWVVEEDWLGREDVASHLHSVKYLDLYGEADTCVTSFLNLTARKLSQLQELHVHYVLDFCITDMIKKLGLFCKNLKCLELDIRGKRRKYEGQMEAHAIARYMPQLCSLVLVRSTLTNKMLLSIIHECPLLQYILLRDCVKIKMQSLLEGRIGSIRQVRIQNEASRAYEIHLKRF